MLMVPIPYLITFVVLFFMLRAILNYKSGEGHEWLILFLLFVAIQYFIVGTRYGYGVDILAMVQPITAAFIPPLAYLAFKRSNRAFGIMVLGVPVLSCMAVYVFAHNGLDFFLAINNLAFGLILVGLCFSPVESMAWVKIGDTRFVLILLITAILLLISSAVIDFLITLDFIYNEGENLQLIVMSATVLGILGWGAAMIGITIARKPVEVVPSIDEQKHFPEHYAKINALMVETQLYLDPDLNLNRIAKRVGLPVRDVSRAINNQTKMSISQYINQLRIQKACELLNHKGSSILQVAYASGFNTKSNFNREFQRVMGKTPTQWRTK